MSHIFKNFSAILFSASVLTTAPFVSYADNTHAETKVYDFGSSVEKLLHHRTHVLFGVKKPLRNTAPESGVPYRESSQNPEDQVLLSKGLHVEYLTRDAGNLTDMFSFFPAHEPSHLISCVEGARAEIAPGKLNPSVQRIHLITGEVETILRGMNRCDGIRTTHWGTVLATEETDDGAAYEILNPLTVTEESVLDRTAGTVTNPARIAKRPALPMMAWEGLVVLSNGVLIGGDELRPGTGTPGSDGGALFKFIPEVPKTDGAPITGLNHSPLVSGKVYALQISCRDDKQQQGQGCEVGNGAWIEVAAAAARSDANAFGATGYYRPEDLHLDPVFEPAANHPNAIRFCWTNTGDEDASHFGEVLCAVDREPALADANERTVITNRFVEGDQDFNSFDNLDFQPHTGILYVVEDHDNGDIFACLRDGADRDIKTDGCIRVLSVKDTSAEPTGFIFSPDGKTAYLSIQHSDDTLMPLVDDYPTDDVLVITGFKIRKH